MNHSNEPLEVYTIISKYQLTRQSQILLEYAKIEILDIPTLSEKTEEAYNQRHSWDTDIIATNMKCYASQAIFCFELMNHESIRFPTKIMVNVRDKKENDHLCDHYFICDRGGKSLEEIYTDGFNCVVNYLALEKKLKQLLSSVKKAP